jgi:hypothetical protein
LGILNLDEPQTVGSVAVSNGNGLKLTLKLNRSPGHSPSSQTRTTEEGTTPEHRNSSGGVRRKQSLQEDDAFVYFTRYVPKRRKPFEETGLPLLECR